MNLKLKGVFSSVVAVGCVAAAVPGLSAFAAGKSSKEDDKSGKSEEINKEEKKEDKKEEEKKKKKEKRKTACDNMSIANSALSIRNSRTRSRLKSNGKMDTLMDLKILEMLQKSLKSLEEKEEKCPLEKAADVVGNTSKFVAKEPIKAALTASIMAGGARVYQYLRNQGYIDDTTIAAVAPDMYKGIKDARMGECDLRKQELSLREQELSLSKQKLSLREQELDVQSKDLDVRGKQSVADFYKDRPELSSVKKYIDFASTVVTNICKGIGSILGLRPGNGNGKS